MSIHQAPLTVASRRRKTTQSAIVLSSQSIKKFRESQDFRVPDPNLSPLEDSISSEMDLSPIPFGTGLRERKKATLLKQKHRNDNANLIAQWWKTSRIYRYNRGLMFRYRQCNRWTLKQSDAVFSVVLKYKTKKFMNSKKYVSLLKGVHEVLAVIYDVFQKAEPSSLLKTLVEKRRVQYISLTDRKEQTEPISPTHCHHNRALDVKTRLRAWLALSVFQELESALTIDRQLAFGLVPDEVQLFRQLIKQINKSKRQLYTFSYGRGSLGRWCHYPSFGYYDTLMYYPEPDTSRNTSTSSMSIAMTPQSMRDSLARKGTPNSAAITPSSVATISTKSTTSSTRTSRSNGSPSQLLSSRDRVALHLEMAAFEDTTLEEELPPPPPPLALGGMAPLGISPNGGRKAKMPFASSYTGMESLIDMSASMEAFGVMGCDIMGPLSPGSKPTPLQHKGTGMATVSPVVQMLMADTDNDVDLLDISNMSVQDKDDVVDNKDDSFDKSSPSIKAMLINLKKPSNTGNPKVVSPMPHNINAAMTPLKQTSASPVRKTNLLSSDSPLSRGGGSAVRKSKLETVNHMLKSLTDMVGEEVCSIGK